MTERAPRGSGRRTPGLRRKIAMLFLLFGLVLGAGLTIQGNLSQQLIVHPIWRDLLQSSTNQYLADGDSRPAGHHLPTSGLVRGWNLRGTTLPGDMPPYFASLEPGYYDEHDMDAYDSDRSHAVLVTPAGDGRIVMAVDITELEDYQNMTAMVSVLIAILSGLMILCSVLWLYHSMNQPIQSLARRMEGLDPEQPSQRLQTDFALRELHDIAVLVNRHLERVERFIERERSLLDQASHEFRTPIAVIAGAVDVLKLYELPPGARRPLERIESTTRNLTEIMAALLFLSREAEARAPVEAIRLDSLAAVLVDDHEHLLQGAQASFVVAELQPLWVECPEAIARIVVGNLLRNAAENSHEGAITVTLADHCLSIQDNGAGFDTVAAARRYTQALRDSTKQGGGQGLGLFLTRRICERFGWTLTISSNPGSGTLAELRFPPARR
ncbi:sensor histidine kinase [Massilia dura]|uniref:histidine kinase n=1 Tax=Pseudoduganella dura TaxID=321982 RepID=A0A6I3XRH4_9BURK|nr:HAMP domain-containing sensor histidine kinase [Pseudoduganella dura]MUI15922.1 sensor histidine kinase [Pseudoduganella dura]GGX94611.1 two-component sensor histidine kinase [Pseudoduganella dura]